MKITTLTKIYHFTCCRSLQLYKKPFSRFKSHVLVNSECLSIYLNQEPSFLSFQMSFSFKKMESQKNESTNNVVASYDLNSILCSPNRDFLVLNKGDQVKVDSLIGKKNIVGLYFSASWCGPCQMFTPNLMEIYDELKELGKFEIVLITHDEDENSFNEYFSKMPWLAIPFSDSDTHKKLNKLFNVNGIPQLTILDQNGNVLTNEGVEIIIEHGADGYPFTREHIEKLIEQKGRNQSLQSLLVSTSIDYVIKKEFVAELEGGTVGLYFMDVTNEKCIAFNSKLVEVYMELKEEGEIFEIVMIPVVHDDDETLFWNALKDHPWFSLAPNDSRSYKLVDYFKIYDYPTIVVIGPDGKTLHSNIVDAIQEHGSRAYPFTPEKFEELEELKKAKQELETLLVSKDSDFVIQNDGVKIPILNLAGKTILLYFSANSCPPCRAFLPILIKAYEEINIVDGPLEVIFISSDKDKESFNEYFAKMPWLAVPFGDERKKSLSRLFKVWGIPMVVAIGPNGKVVTTEVGQLITRHGAEAYPFTAERLKEIEEETKSKIEEGWPMEVKYESHEHALVLTKRQIFECDGCDEEGHEWSYYCEECDFDLHVKCALGHEDNDDDDKGEEGKNDLAEFEDGEIIVKTVTVISTRRGI